VTTGRGERAWLLGVGAWVLTASVLALAWGDALEASAWTSARAWLGELDAAVRAEPVLAAVAYTLVGVVGGATGLPPPTVVGLTGGAVFGTPVALPWTVVTVLVGATLAFLAARGWLRPRLERRLGARLAGIQAVAAERGGAYLLSLRLTPLVPNNLVNIAMGLANMRPRSFVLATLVGRLPAAVLYCQAGDTLAGAVAAGRILTPGVVAVLAAVALLPLAGRALAPRIGSTFDRKPKAT
jgi:uncharacterized membrane protein YdjX (TVP38/TMEM64 family)